MYQETCDENGQNSYDYLNAEVYVHSFTETVDVLHTFAEAMDQVNPIDVEEKAQATNQFIDAALCGIIAPTAEELELFGDPHLAAINCRLFETKVPSHSSFDLTRDFDSAIGICDTLPLSGSLAVSPLVRYARTLTKPMHLHSPAFLNVS